MPMHNNAPLRIHRHLMNISLVYLPFINDIKKMKVHSLYHNTFNRHTWEFTITRSPRLLWQFMKTMGKPLINLHEVLRPVTCAPRSPLRHILFTLEALFTYYFKYVGDYQIIIVTTHQVSCANPHTHAVKTTLTFDFTRLSATAFHSIRKWGSNNTKTVKTRKPTIAYQSLRNFDFYVAQ